MRWLFVLVVSACAHREPAPATVAATPSPPPVPPAPSCDDAAAKYRTLHASANAVGAHEIALGRCRGELWGDQARTCLAGATTLAAAEACSAQLTPAQREGFTTDIARLVAQAGARFAALPDGCQRYAWVVERYLRCPAVDAPTKEALRAAFEQAMAAWATVPDEARPALETACTAAADALTQSITSC